MEKKTNKPNGRYEKIIHNARLIAQTYGCDPSYVYKVLRGQRAANSTRAKKIILYAEELRLTTNKFNQPNN